MGKGQPSEGVRTRAEEAAGTPPRAIVLLQVVTALLCLCMGAWAAARPEVVYAPTAKAVLFLMVSIVPAVLFASAAAVRLKFGWPGFSLLATGGAGIAIALLLILDHISQPEEQAFAYDIMDERSEPLVGLEAPGAVTVTTSNGMSPNYCVSGNRVYFVIPEQVAAVTLGIKSGGVTYSTKIGYGGERRQQLTLGADLRSARAP